MNEDNRNNKEVELAGDSIWDKEGGNPQKLWL